MYTHTLIKLSLEIKKCQPFVHARRTVCGVHCSSERANHHIRSANALGSSFRNTTTNPVQIPLEEMDWVSKEEGAFAEILRGENQRTCKRFIAQQTEASFVAEGVWKSRGDSRMEWVSTEKYAPSPSGDQGSNSLSSPFFPPGGLLWQRRWLPITLSSWRFRFRLGPDVGSK